MIPFSYIVAEFLAFDRERTLERAFDLPSSVIKLWSIGVHQPVASLEHSVREFITLWWQERLAE